MNETLLIIIAALLTVLVAVFAYNMIQESRYRNKIRSQFGHSDQDALMGSQTQSVRDGRSLSHEKISSPEAPAPMLKPSIVGKNTPVTKDDDDIDLSELLDDLDDYDDDKSRQNNPASYSSVGLDLPEPELTNNVKASELPAPSGGFMSGLRATFNRMLNSISDDDTPQNASTAKTKETESIGELEDLDDLDVYDETPLPAPSALLIDFEDLKRSRLTWFDKRIDYLTYVSLREPQELLSVPRLSNRYRVQVIGCTMDGSFQVAEPVPGVLYQAFVIGMQAINRNGLVSERELNLFGQQVEHFAENMGGDALLEDTQAFLNVAKPLDELCARVDQIIAIHLVSRVSILGSELRNSLEKLGFQLQDGAFAYLDEKGRVKFNAVTLDGSEFTPQLLASQPYKGFSMLFDITHVPYGEQHFEEFVNLAVALSQSLHLELVDDQIQQVSTDWLKNIRTFVLEKQLEMIDAHIPSGGELAQRVFS